MEDEELRKEAHKAAQAEYVEAFCTGTLGQGEFTAAAIAARASENLPEGCKPITAGALKAQFCRHKKVVSPKKPGPRPVLPGALVKSIAGYAQLQQAEGNEQKPRFLAARAVAAVKGTSHEERLISKSQKQRLLSRVKRETAGLSTATAVAVNDRRYRWLTRTNLRRWFVGYIACLRQHKFLETREVICPSPKL